MSGKKKECVIGRCIYVHSLGLGVATRTGKSVGERLLTSV